MEYVEVVFNSGKTGTILKAEYEAGKDKGYIKGLKETEQKVLESNPENKELKKQNKKK